MDTLKRFWKQWLAFSRKIGDLVGRVAMTLFYFTLMLPFGIGVRLFSDPLNIKSAEPRWQTSEADDQTLEGAHKQF